MNKLFLCLLTLSTVFTLEKGWALPFENGNFAQGKSRWEGEGQVAYLKADDTIEPADVASDPVADQVATDPNAPPDKTPLIEIKLSKTSFHHIAQKFTTPDGTHSLKVTVVYKTTPDFKRREKSPTYSTFVYWKADEFVNDYWGAYVFPAVDMFVRMDRQDDYSSYRLQMVKPDADWQTLKFEVSNFFERQESVINIFAPPGEGSLFIKSVLVTK